MANCQPLNRELAAGVECDARGGGTCIASADVVHGVMSSGLVIQTGVCMLRQSDQQVGRRGFHGG